ncbi:MAG TPA: PRC-barrel domain-containing protein [Acidimicrobiia bacterium]
MADLWTWREMVVIVTPVGGGAAEPTNPIQGTDVTGFDVEATDGHIGKVDEATYETGGSYLVVDTGFWIFGKKRMIPAGLVERVEPEERKVYLRASKGEIKKAPDYNAERKSAEQRDEVDAHYGAGADR